ncbi:isochorismatase family hydrolase [Nitrosococcus halophilus Nc 4]|uniref:Isochorismatase family hydrolase n=1 Tax=Nitrosococcus halophilus (strain Nc4) TaxID=472759 RepID=D5C090_NITHN|nr:hypothetical protein [Nitrosococcus halophilus]ADE14416.1 isochorismatase family hydrolase [Nitrosococcus halophilus Nc 4]
MLIIAEAYKTRPIRFLGLWEISGWKLKAYGISYANQIPGQQLIDAAHRVTGERLSASAAKTHHYGVGFVGIHEGKTGNFVFVDWWADENELHHHVYLSPSEQPAALEYMTPTGLTACAWDLFLISHERDAWVNHVLKQAAAPDLEG